MKRFKTYEETYCDVKWFLRYMGAEVEGSANGTFGQMMLTLTNSLTHYGTAKKKQLWLLVLQLSEARLTDEA
jgi:hypothetical protein